MSIMVNFIKYLMLMFIVHADVEVENDAKISCAIDNVLKRSVIMNLTT